MNRALQRPRHTSQNTVAGTERHMAHMGPLTTFLPLDEFERWFSCAPVGAFVAYAVGVGLSGGQAVCARVRELAEAGHLELSQAPVLGEGAGRKFEYRARRLSASVPASAKVVKAPPAAEREAGIAGTSAGRVLDELKRAANFGRCAPSLAEIQRGCGLSTRSQARYQMQKLIEMGLIEIVDRQGQRRIVRIVSSGKQTKGAAV